MARIFTIDGLKGMRSYERPRGPARALGLVRWAAWQGLRDAAEDVEAKVDRQMFWLKVGVGVAASAAVLTLVVTLVRVARKG